MRILRGLLTLSMLAAVAACATHPSRTPSPSSGYAADLKAFDVKAAAVVRAWPRTDMGRAWSSALIPLESLTVLPPGVKPTYRSLKVWGFIDAAPNPPAGPESASVTFADRSSLRVAVDDAAGSYREMLHNDTPACATPPAAVGLCSLTITRIRYGQTTILTSRGEASVPAWILTTKQVTAPIAQVAVDPSAITLPTPRLVGAGVQYIVSIDGDRVTYTSLTGSCDTAIRPLLYETATAVVVGTSIVDNVTDCNLDGHMTPETVTLKAPLGTRPLLTANGDLLTMGPIGPPTRW
jgi:hypothetical protein